jgi:3-oxoisoapionate kinase
MAPARRRPLACFYGDDFTGSTDALGQFARFGWRSVLLLSLEALEQAMGELDDFDVVGVAGITRSLSADALAAELRHGFAALARLRPRVVQYKVCSTFDSGPDVGSIGRAAEVGREVFGPATIPVLPAQPEFGRYTAFGNHFAAHAGAVMRLDRNPATAEHAVTPMREADLGRHLSEQTSLRIGYVDIRAVQGAPGRLERAIEAAAAGADLAVLDALTNDDLRRIGALLPAGDGEAPAFTIGSGGLSYGMAGFLGDDPVPPGDFIAPRSAVDRLLVVSGSCSAQTAAQIRAALDRGWAGVPLGAAELIADGAAALEQACAAVLDALRAGRSVVVFTAAGPEDPGVAAGVAAAERAGLGPGGLAPVVGRAFATLVRVARGEGLTRMLVAGGDTCGCTVGELDAWGLEVLGAVVPAGFLCRLRSHAPGWDGLEVLLKGGQVGGTDLFGQVQTGCWRGVEG